MAASSSFVLNDTLKISKEQWFPAVCEITQYLAWTVKYDDFVGQIFTFQKPKLRNFVVPPVRCFLVENIAGKQVYRGHCHILNVTLDYEKNTTSWTYKIIKIFSPEQMPVAFDLIDANTETNYFA